MIVTGSIQASVTQKDFVVSSTNDSRHRRRR